MTAEPVEPEVSNKQWWLKVSAALFYAFSSFMITTVNKVILTTYKFPSYQVLGIGQMVATVFVLYISKRFRWITFPDFTREVSKKLFPLPVFYLGNLWFGLGGTKSVSLPMFTVLRRFSVLMTMALQYYILGTKSSLRTQVSVYLMVLGALIAASDDLGFEFWGYLYILLNNAFTAANNVYVKKKVDSKELGKYGVMYYNALFMVVPVVLVAWHTGDIDLAMNYKSWSDPTFLIQFVLSCMMGFLLTLSIFLCTSFNSALTTTVIGCLKNVLVTYLGMFIGGDYIYTATNFFGLNLSVFASLYYTYVVFFTQTQTQEKPTKESKERQISESSQHSDARPIPEDMKQEEQCSKNDRLDEEVKPWREKTERNRSGFLDWIARKRTKIQQETKKTE